MNRLDFEHATLSKRIKKWVVRVTENDLFTKAILDLTSTLWLHSSVTEIFKQFNDKALLFKCGK